MGFLVHVHHHIDDITYPSGRYTVYIGSYELPFNKNFYETSLRNVNEQALSELYNVSRMSFKKNHFKMTQDFCYHMEFYCAQSCSLACFPSVSCMPLPELYHKIMWVTKLYIKVIYCVHN